MRLENEFLRSFPASDRDALRSDLSQIELSQKTVLFEAGEVNETIYFPLSGVVSLVARIDTDQITELAMIGRDGVVGGSSALSSEPAICDAIVQIPTVALAIRTKRLRLFVQDRPKLFEAIRLFDLRLSAQFVRSAGCLAAHTLEQRLARWLLRAQALAGDDLSFTQAFMGQMLTVRRAGVSVAADALQQSGAIRYVRGTVTVTDAKKLRMFSCSCAAED